MKKLKLIILLVIFVGINTLNAQKRTIDVNASSAEDYSPQSGDYLKNNKYDDFVGLYTYSNNNGTVFKMTLEKKIFYYKVSDAYFDRIFGSYEYKKENKNIVKKVDIIQKEKISLEDLKNNEPQISSIKLLEDNQMEIRIIDKLNNKNLKGVLSKLDNGKYSLKISEEKGGINITAKKAQKSMTGMILPKEMTLIKE